MLKQCLALANIFLQRSVRPFPTITFKGNYFFAAQKPRHPIFQTLLVNEEKKDIYEILSEVQTLDKNDKIEAMRLIIKKAISQQLPIQILQSDQFLSIASVHPAMMVISLVMLCQNRHENIAHFDSQLEVFNCIAKAKINIRRCYEVLEKLPKQQVFLERINLAKVEEKYIWTQYMIEEDPERKEKIFQKSCEAQRFILNGFQKLITQKIELIKNDKSLKGNVKNEHFQLLIRYILDCHDRAQTLKSKIQIHEKEVEDKKLLVFGLEEYISNLELLINFSSEFDLKEFEAHSLKFKKQIVKNKWFYQILTDQVSEKEAGKGLFDELQFLLKICERELKDIGGEPKYDKEIQRFAYIMLEIKQDMDYCEKQLKGEQMLREEFIEIRKRNIDDILSLISNQEMRKNVKDLFAIIMEQEEKQFANMSNHKDQE